MYAPKYTITNRILRDIGKIEASKEIVDNAPLVPSFEKQFQGDAIFRIVYHGTHIEGNDLTAIQTKKVLEGQEVYARPRDVQEVINYRNVIKIVDELSKSDEQYNIDMLTKIQAIVVYRVVPEDKVGVLRKTQVVIREEGTGKVIMSPPSFVEVPYLLEDFFEWLNSPEAKEIHPIIRAAIAHYNLTAIHPFVEGNGRTARAFSILIMLREGYDIKRFFAIEEHFDKDLAAYYEAFFKVDSVSPDIAERNLTPWIEYFTDAVAIELEKIKEKVRKLSIDTRLKLKIGKQIALTERQMRLVEYLSDQGAAMMRDLKTVLPMISEDTVLRELTNLIKKGIIRKEGSTKSAKYVLSGKS